MDSSFDVSFNTTELLQDHQLDITDLLAKNEDFLTMSPMKKVAGPKENLPHRSLSTLSLPDLPCLFELPTNELFQMTHHLREKESLHNNKIQKLLELLQGENEEFDLDDQLRTRVFRARAAKSSHATALDPFDMQLDAFLRDQDSRNNHQFSLPLRKRGLGAKMDKTLNNNNDNKENISPVLGPSKRKLSDSVAQPPLKKAKSYGSIPLLQASRNIHNIDINDTDRTGDNLSIEEVKLSPQRVCVPRASGTPGKPNIKLQDSQKIYLVAALTGSVVDATQFGTELNASNCEGFPLPENTSEIVQIPTNDTCGPSNAQKMAIIKALKGKRHVSHQSPDAPALAGFYSRREFVEHKLKAQPKVSIFQDAQKRVRWADELEW